MVIAIMGVLLALTQSLGLGGHTGHLGGGLPGGADVGQQAPGRHGSPQDGGGFRIHCCRERTHRMKLLGSKGMEGGVGRVAVAGDSSGAPHLWCHCQHLTSQCPSP